MKEQLGMILLANGAVLVIPGLNFAILTRYAIQHGMRAAVYCTVGITLAIAVHVIFAMLGSWQIMSAMPSVFRFIQFAGSGYIFYMATRILFNVFKIVREPSNAVQNLHETPFTNGLMIDLLNPFITIFYFGLFSSVLSQNVTFMNMVVYLIFILSITFLWFSFVSLVFSRAIIKNAFQNIKQVIECSSAIILYYYAVKLFFTAIG